MLVYAGTLLENERGMLAGSMISSAKTQPYQIIDHCETASIYVTLMSAITLSQFCLAFVADVCEWLVLDPLSRMQNLLLEISIGILHSLYNDVTQLDRTGAISRSTSSGIKRKRSL